jgi:CHAD domain-containing protein
MVDQNTVEREVKLTVSLDFDLPDLRPVVGRTVRRPEEQLLTAYFDTHDFRLWRRGMTLRRRTTQGRAGVDVVWTLKLPEGGDGQALDRGELSWASDARDVPLEAHGLLRGIVRRARLRQVAELVTRRQRLSLCNEGGTAWGELDDDDVRVQRRGRQDDRFRQLELEWWEGGRPMVQQVVRQLRAAGARPEPAPKLARAVPDLAFLTTTTEVAPQAPVGVVVTSAIAGSLGRLLDHDFRMRLSGHDPEADDVHQARVATRRLRSDLKTFRVLLDPVWVDHTRGELKWLGALLGRVRDVDVLTGSVSPEDDGTPGRIELCRRIAAERRMAVEELAESLGSRRYLTVLDRLEAAALSPPFFGRVAASENASEVLASLLHRPWRVLHRRVREAGKRPTDAELHRIRIGAKQLRYACEVATPVLGWPAQRTARAAERLQTVLGSHHDAVGAEQWLRGVAGLEEQLAAGRAFSDGVGAERTALEAAFEAGWLACEQHERQDALRERWPSVWSKLDRKRHRSWMT